MLNLVVHLINLVFQIVRKRAHLLSEVKSFYVIVEELKEILILVLQLIILLRTNTNH